MEHLKKTKNKRREQCSDLIVVKRACEGLIAHIGLYTQGVEDCNEVMKRLEATNDLFSIILNHNKPKWN